MTDEVFDFINIRSERYDLKSSFVANISVSDNWDLASESSDFFAILDALFDNFWYAILEFLDPGVHGPGDIEKNAQFHVEIAILLRYFHNLTISLLSTVKAIASSFNCFLEATRLQWNGWALQRLKYLSVLLLIKNWWWSLIRSHLLWCQPSIDSGTKFGFNSSFLSLSGNACSYSWLFLCRVVSLSCSSSLGWSVSRVVVLCWCLVVYFEGASWSHLACFLFWFHDSKLRLVSFKL